MINKTKPTTFLPWAFLGAKVQQIVHNAKCFINFLLDAPLKDTATVLLWLLQFEFHSFCFHRSEVDGALTI